MNVKNKLTVSPKGVVLYVTNAVPASRILSGRVLFLRVIEIWRINNVDRVLCGLCGSSSGCHLAAERSNRGVFNFALS